MRHCKHCQKEFFRGDKRTVFCSSKCFGAFRSATHVKNRRPLVRGPVEGKGMMTRAEVAAQLTREDAAKARRLRRKIPAPWTEDRVEAIELRALSKLYTSARMSVAIRELLCLAS